MSELAQWLLLGGVAVLTSIVSGVLGMAGGLLLLAALLFFFDPLLAIPLHGIVQLVSNGSRAVLLYPHVDRRAVLRFIWPLLPAALLGLLVIRSLPAGASRIAIGAFVLFATWAPKQSKPAGRSRQTAERALPLGGALIGFFSTTVGATGPLLAPFVLALELGPQGTIATLAACQIFQHASKVLAFGAAGFDFARFTLPALGLCAAAILGTAIGTRLLAHVPEQAFRRVIKLVLTALALELVIEGALALPR